VVSTAGAELTDPPTETVQLTCAGGLVEGHEVAVGGADVDDAAGNGRRVDTLPPSEVDQTAAPVPALTAHRCAPASSPKNTS
jgi:hypothetical protein